MIVKIATNDNISDILRIQKLCYGDEQLESYEVFESILQDNHFSFVIVDENHVCGYIIAHLWKFLKKPPKLHTKLDINNNNNKCCFIHDLAIEPAYQNRGLALELIDNLMKCVKPLQIPITLVAVNNANNFWKKNGFIEYDCDYEILESYKTDSAIFMVKFIKN